MSLPRMSWHIGDYQKDTGHLRAAGHGAYFLLCMHYWANGGLPNDDKQLATIARMTDREWKTHRPVLRAFFKGEGEWRHKRIDEEMADAMVKYEKRSKAGRNGNAKRWRGDATCDPNAIPMRSQPITDNPNPTGKNPERKKDAADAAPATLFHVPAQPTPEADFFKRCKELLGPSAGGSLGAKLLKAKGGSVPLARAAIEQASTKQDAREYVGAIIRGQSPNDRGMDPRL